MAILRARKNSKGKVIGYAAVFYDPMRHPKEKYVTLRTKDRRVAGRKLTALEQKESLGHWDPWTDAAPRDGLLVNEAVAEYIRKRKDARRPKTVQADESTLNLFVASLPPGCLLSQIEPQYVHRFLAHRQEPGALGNTDDACRNAKTLSSSSRQTYFARIRSFIKWCNDNGLMRHDPTAKLERPKLARKEKSFLTHEQYERLRRAIDADATMKETGMVKGASLKDGEIRWLLDVIEVAVSTGLRVGELTNMRWSWVNLDAGHIVVTSSDAFVPKSHHERTIPVSGECIAVLRRLNEIRSSEGDSYVFASVEHGGKLDATYVSKRFKKYVRLAKLPDKFTFHTLRHTFVTWGIQAGVPVPVMQKLAGHADLATTMTYVHVAGGDLHHAVRTINERRRQQASA